MYINITIILLVPASVQVSKIYICIRYTQLQQKPAGGASLDG